MVISYLVIARKPPDGPLITTSLGPAAPATSSVQVALLLRPKPAKLDWQVSTPGARRAFLASCGKLGVIVAAAAVVVGATAVASGITSEASCWFCGNTLSHSSLPRLVPAGSV